MKNLIAFAASVAINLSVLSALDWSAAQAQAAPRGEVSVLQLPLDADLAVYARASDS